MSKHLLQCVKCGFLQNGVVQPRPCLYNNGDHTFEPLSKHTVAAALGSTGGRPPIYKTNEERREARLQSFQRYNRKRRLKHGDDAQ